MLLPYNISHVSRPIPSFSLLHVFSLKSMSLIVYLLIIIIITCIYKSYASEKCALIIGLWNKNVL